MTISRDLEVWKSEEFNKETGEIVELVNAKWLRSAPKVIFDYKPPKLKVDPYYIVQKGFIKMLDDNELVLFMRMVEYVGYQNNFLFDKNNIPFTMTKLSKELKKNLTYFSRILSSLENKGYIKLVSIGNTKIIYIYSKYVWRGKTEKKSDIILDDFNK